MPCEDLSNLEEKDYNYKSYFNFITLLTVIVGNSDFILKEMGIPLSYVKRKGQIDVKHKGITFVGGIGVCVVVRLFLSGDYNLD